MLFRGPERALEMLFALISMVIPFFRDLAGPSVAVDSVIVVHKLEAFGNFLSSQTLVRHSFDQPKMYNVNAAVRQTWFFIATNILNSIPVYQSKSIDYMFASKSSREDEAAPGVREQ